MQKAKKGPALAGQSEWDFAHQKEELCKKQMGSQYNGMLYKNVQTEAKITYAHNIVVSLVRKKFEHIIFIKTNNVFNVFLLFCDAVFFEKNIFLFSPRKYNEAGITQSNKFWRQTEERSEKIPVGCDICWKVSNGLDWPGRGDL